MKRSAGILALWLLIALTLSGRAAAQPPLGPPPVTAVAAVGMTVADLDRSVDFYSKVLSFEKVSDVEVAGSEYERLQGVFGLRMRVVRMKLGDEVLELTEYLAPRDGRPMPPDVKANDLVHWQTRLVTDEITAVARRARTARAQFVSPGVIGLSDATLGFRKGLLVRDADGHAMLVAEP